MIDIKTQFLSDEDADVLYSYYPDLPASVEDGCVTCENTGQYYFRGAWHDCDCEEQIQLTKLYLNANIGMLYQRLDFDDYQGDAKAKKLALTYLDNHRKMIKSGMGLIYSSEEYGTGKSMLVSLIAKELVKHGYSVYFSTFNQLIDMFTKGWRDNKEKARFEGKILKSDVFILDDLGKEYKTKSNLEESTFDHVLRQRVINAKPIFLTTNLDKHHLQQGYGKAVFSLLVERCIFHYVEGRDWRENANNRSLQEIQNGETRPVL